MDRIGQDQEDHLDAPGGPLAPDDDADAAQDRQDAHADWLYDTFADLDT